MKLGNLLFSFLFFLILIFGSLFFYSSNYTEDSYFNQEVENNLANLANTRVERINNYFDEFKTLAIQSLGNQGYSAIAGDSNIILFHKYDSFIGKNLFALGNPEALNLVNLARITGESQGFFNWTDPDNITRKKYGKLIRIPPEIFNESILIIVVTSYTQDYKELNNVSLETQNYLTNLKNSYDFYNLDLISPNGEIIYCNQQIIDHNGENLLWEENLDEGDSKHFIIVKNDLKLSVFGPFIESYGDIYPKISIMNPVYDSDKKLLWR